MIFQDIQYKAQCFYGDSSRNSRLKVLFSDGTSAVILYRMGKYLQRIGLGIIANFIFEMNKFFNGCVIGRNATFGEGLILMHPLGVVINSGVKGMNKIVIESGVVIGAKDNGLPVRVPQLGSDIFIGSGAKILGGIQIGNRVKIGANSVVVKDVPDGATVVGIPGTIIKIEDEAEKNS